MTPPTVQLRDFPSSLQVLSLSGEHLSFSHQEVSSLQNIKTLRFGDNQQALIKPCLSSLVTSLSINSLAPDLLPHLDTLLVLKIYSQTTPILISELPVLKEIDILIPFCECTLKSLPSLRILKLDY